jgi:AraC family transcriptional regulator
MDMTQADFVMDEDRSTGTSGITELGNSVGHCLSSARATLASDPTAAQGFLERLAALLSVSDAGGQNDAPLPEPVVVAFGHPGGLAKWQWRKVQCFIEERLAEPIQIEILAGLVHLSCGYFSRAFKVSTGDTPHAYIVRQRVRRAQMLMLKTNEPLSEIALMCGFADQAHLTRNFTRHVCQTPFVWRRNFKVTGPKQ